MNNNFVVKDSEYPEDVLAIFQDPMNPDKVCIEIKQENLRTGKIENLLVTLDTVSARKIIEQMNDFLMEVYKGKEKTND